MSIDTVIDRYASTIRDLRTIYTMLRNQDLLTPDMVFYDLFYLFYLFLLSTNTSQGRSCLLRYSSLGQFHVGYRFQSGADLPLEVEQSGVVVTLRALSVQHHI